MPGSSPGMTRGYFDAHASRMANCATTSKDLTDMKRKLLRALLLSAATLAAPPAFAARGGGDFNTFVQNISAEAVAAGVSQGVVSQALGGVTVDGGVLAFDRRQRYTFNKTFEQYVATRVGPGRDGGWRRARLRPPPALHLQQDLRAICRDPRRPR